MKHTAIARAIALILAAAPAALAQTPALLTYQGRVQTGTPAADFTGTGQFKFALVDQSPNLQRQAVAGTPVRNGQTISSIPVTNGGAGYTTAPNVAIGPPQVVGGVQARATAVLTNGAVSSITIDVGGSGYSSAPSVTLTAPPPTPPTIIWNNHGPVPASPVNAVSLAVTNGLYSVMLGDTSLTNMAAIPPAVFARPDVRLRVWFNGTQLSPDQRLAPNGYLPGGTTVNGDFLITGAAQALALELRAPGLTPYVDFSSGTADFDARIIYLPGDNSLRVEGASRLSLDSDLSFPANGEHFISVARQAAPNLAGHWLTVEAGSAQGQSGTAQAGGGLHLKAGNGYNATVNGAGGGDVIISSGGNWIDAGVSGDNGGDIVFNTGGANNSFAERLRIGENGNVGIGTIGNNPAGAKLIVNGGVDGSPGSGPYMNTTGGSFTVTGHGTHSISIKATGTIVTNNTFVAASDARIKTITGRSDSRTDLTMLRNIEVTDYRYKDTVAQGDVQQKKVIAQQVEKVFPSAVTKITNVVPDIFQKATIKDGWIELATDLKKSERVRLLSEKEEVIQEVLEVRAGGFRTAYKPADDKIFVYGREVKDFRTVDYEAIAMLNVSATQELARKLESKDAELAALQKENAALKAEVAANAARDEAQDAKLAALTALLEKQSSVAAATAGVSTVPAKR